MTDKSTLMHHRSQEPLDGQGSLGPSPLAVGVLLQYTRTAMICCADADVANLQQPELFQLL